MRKPSALTIRLLQRAKSPTEMNCRVLKILCPKNTPPTVEKGTHVESPPNEIDVVLLYVAMLEDQWKHHVSWPLHC